MKLTGKIALITGGTTGIGAATARLFQEEGATVIVTGSNPRTLDEARAAMPGVEVIAADAADIPGTRTLVDAVVARHGRIDILFVNAGIAHFAPIEQVDEAFFDRQFGINVRGAYFIIKHAAAAMPDGGAILLTASVSGVVGMAGATVYGATKAALRACGPNFAAELAPRRIRVNTISPGPIETPIFGKLGLPAEHMSGMVEGIVAKVPLGRVARRRRWPRRRFSSPRLTARSPPAPSCSSMAAWPTSDPLTFPP